MLEIYLFVNPLGGICLNTEKTILNIVNSSEKKIHFRFIPLLNPHSLNEMIKKRGLPKKDLNLRNRLFQDQYNASLDYKAASLQGKKLGRLFLLRLQRAVAEEKKGYSYQLTLEIATEIGLDLDMFREDRRSDLVEHLFEEDQQLACEMNIKVHPSAVIYNFEQEADDFGVLVEDCEALGVLERVCHWDFAENALPHCLSNNPKISEIHMHHLFVL